jgi:hypothetical protein
MIKLKINTLRGGRWHDKNKILLHAAFQLLVDFIEQEQPAKLIDWSADARNRKAWKEIMSLYRWWKKERPLRKCALDRKNIKWPIYKTEKVPGKDLWKWVEPDRRKYAAYYRLMKLSWRQKVKRAAEDQKNLHRLIDIREHLWT